MCIRDSGKTMYDILRLRNQVVENVPDAVLYPDTKEQIERIVAYCAQELSLIHISYLSVSYAGKRKL